jgi:hypothetical protein
MPAHGFGLPRRPHWMYARHDVKETVLHEGDTLETDAYEG